MQGDKITKKQLFKYIGKNRFDTEDEFKDFIKPRIKEMLAIPKDRLGEESASSASDDNRYDIYVYDKETNRETLILIGLKVNRKYPKFIGDDIEKFNSFCMDKKVLYSVLLSETECRMFKYEKKDAAVDVIEIEETPPLNHIDYEFSKVMNTEKLKDLALSKKPFLIAAISIIFFILLINIVSSVICSSSGPIKGNINKEGQKNYYLPDSPGYKNIIIGDQPGERRFCSENNAVSKGWKKVQSAAPTTKK